MLELPAGSFEPTTLQCDEVPGASLSEADERFPKRRPAAQCSIEWRFDGHAKLSADLSQMLILSGQLGASMIVSHLQQNCVSQI